MNEKTYERVIEYLKQQIQEGKLSCGSKIPSERELAASLNLGRNSVREALRTMEHTGMLESRQGKGNFLVNIAAEKSGKCVFHDAAHRTEQLQGSQPNPANPGAGGICTGSAVEKSGSFKEAESRNKRDADTGKERQSMTEDSIKELIRAGEESIACRSDGIFVRSL